MAILDELKENKVDVGSLAKDALDFNKRRFLVFPENKTMRDILITGEPGRRCVLLLDFLSINVVGAPLGRPPQYVNTCKHICQNLCELTRIKDLSDAVFFRTYYGSKNYCGMSGEEDFDSFFDEYSKDVSSYRYFTFGISFSPDVCSLYGAIKMMHCLRSAFINNYDIKMIIPDHYGRYTYCIDLNYRYLRDLELWNSKNGYRDINNFPYSWLFSYILGSDMFSPTEMQQAINHYADWIDKCYCKNGEQFAYGFAG